jgi:prepilin-type N-terminal cleavage/methylation domain-containing protein
MTATRHNETGTSQGFTLVEVLLVVALMAMVAGMMVFIDRTYIVRNDLDVSTRLVTESLRQAQALAMDGQADSPWGIRIQSNMVTVFSGTSYTERNTENDLVQTLPSSVGISGIHEVVFSKLWGEPNTTGNVVLSTSVNSSRVVSINAKGSISN